MSTIVATSLIDKLKGIQVRESISGNEFARKLGISPQLYHMTKNGKRDIGLEVLRAIARAYPELNRDVLFFLSGDVNSLTGAGSDFTTPSDTAQNRPRAVFRMIVDKCYAAFNLLRRKGHSD